MMLLDLKNAYLHVPTHPSHWRYLRFALRNGKGEFCLSKEGIGLIAAPRVFTKLQAPVVAHCICRDVSCTRT